MLEKEFIESYCIKENDNHKILVDIYKERNEYIVDPIVVIEEQEYRITVRYKGSKSNVHNYIPMQIVLSIESFDGLDSMDTKKWKMEYSTASKLKVNQLMLYMANTITESHGFPSNFEYHHPKDKTQS